MREVISQVELARLKTGEVAYVREISASEAHKLFPDVEGIPDVRLYAVFKADGNALALTDSRAAALRHLIDGNLALQRLQ